MEVITKNNKVLLDELTITKILNNYMDTTLHNVEHLLKEGVTSENIQEILVKSTLNLYETLPQEQFFPYDVGVVSSANTHLDSYPNLLEG